MQAKLVILITLALVAVGLGCAEPQYVTDEEEPRIDDYTMSLRFDRKDLERLYDENADVLYDSSIVKQWERQATSGTPPVVAVFPMKNETSEHIGGQLDALLAKIETDLVNNSPADVVSYDDQPDLIAEIKRQQSDAYDPGRLARYGKQLGAQYFVTGKVYDSAERIGDERRVQYFMFMQVLDVETGAIKFQHESGMTKGLIK